MPWLPFATVVMNVVWVKGPLSENTPHYHQYNAVTLPYVCRRRPAPIPVTSLTELEWRQNWPSRFTSVHCCTFYRQLCGHTSCVDTSCVDTQDVCWFETNFRQVLLHSHTYRHPHALSHTFRHRTAELLYIHNRPRPWQGSVLFPASKRNFNSKTRCLKFTVRTQRRFRRRPHNLWKRNNQNTWQLVQIIKIDAR